jgi:hypothetical protein
MSGIKVSPDSTINISVCHNGDKMAYLAKVTMNGENIGTIEISSDSVFGNFIATLHMVQKETNVLRYVKEFKHLAGETATVMSNELVRGSIALTAIAIVNAMIERGQGLEISECNKGERT